MINSSQVGARKSGASGGWFSLASSLPGVAMTAPIGGPDQPTELADDIIERAAHRAMSALGQKQTHAGQQRMSALLPIATGKADMSAYNRLTHGGRMMPPGVR
jgi:hypothetical protein